jgi:hypothetical protein
MGPEGEQFEFVQALGPVKQTFKGALETRNRMPERGQAHVSNVGLDGDEIRSCVASPGPGWP